PVPGAGPPLPALRGLPAGLTLSFAGELPAVLTLPMRALPAVRALPAGERALPAAWAPTGLHQAGEPVSPAAGAPVPAARPVVPAAGPRAPAVAPRFPSRSAVRSRTLPGGSSLAPARFATCLLEIFPRKAWDILNKSSQLFPCCSPAARGPGGR